MKMCQTAFNHGAVGHPASREQRSKISSGARSPESLLSLALSDISLLHHQERIHSEGQMRIFLSHTTATEQPLHLHYVIKTLHLHKMIHTARNKQDFLAWWCKHLMSTLLFHESQLSDSDQFFGALECNISFITLSIGPLFDFCTRYLARQLHLAKEKGSFADPFLRIPFMMKKDVFNIMSL